MTVSELPVMVSEAEDPVYGFFFTLNPPGTVKRQNLLARLHTVFLLQARKHNIKLKHPNSGQYRLAPLGVLGIENLYGALLLQLLKAFVKLLVAAKLFVM
jgi:hypothetical protein